MAIHDLYSKRLRRSRGEVSDTYEYDNIDGKVRLKLWYTLQDALGAEAEYNRSDKVGKVYQDIVSILRREYGVASLADRRTRNALDELDSFFQAAPVEKMLDVLELCCRAVERICSKHEYLYRGRAAQISAATIDEVNQRLKEEAVGYQYTDGEIVRVDSELIHAEVVKPALRLLNGPGFAGAQEEFLSAHEHYRHGKNKEALVDCLKAFESTMKAICDKRGWTRDQNATAKALIAILFDKELIPTFWQNHMSSLRSGLEGAIPTGRNKLAGHGQGSDPVSVPDSIAGYMLHMTASTIVFLVEAEKDMPSTP